MSYKTPLHLACNNEHIGIVSILLRMNANPNARNSRQETPLHLAVRKGALAIVAKLLDKGAHLMARDVEGSTPLHYLFAEKRKLVQRIEAQDAIEEKTAGETTVLWAKEYVKDAHR